MHSRHCTGACWERRWFRHKGDSYETQKNNSSASLGVKTGENKKKKAKLSAPGSLSDIARLSDSLPSLALRAPTSHHQQPQTGAAGAKHQNHKRSRLVLIYVLFSGAAVVTSEGWRGAWQPASLGNPQGNEELYYSTKTRLEDPGQLGVSKSVKCDVSACFDSVGWVTRGASGL